MADVLDPQGAQENLDDEIFPNKEIFTDGHPGTFENSTEPSAKAMMPQLKFKATQDYHQEIRTFDKRQRLIFNYVAKDVHSCTRGNRLNVPRLIVHEDTGTGKSLVINCIMIYALHELSQAGSSVDKPSALVVAPTGMAASLVNGITIHSALNLSFGNKFASLSDASLDALRSSLGDLRLLIVDEMSMVRSDMLYQSHERLQQISNKSNKILNCSATIILFGDLLQLKPVQGNFIFERPRNERNPGFFKIDDLWQKFDAMILNKIHRFLFTSL